MRTLKKTLCMVLALVMVLGFCAFSVAASDFTDADEITYTEAVDVLSGIGVITGMGDGTFNPNGTLTRAQACVIITKLMGGAGITAKSTFTDMEGFAWAESYVAFCQAKGIVGGYGDGRFGPGDTLKGSQWARMLFLAAGFDAKENGFESGNATWEVGVAKLVKDQKLAARVADFDGTQEISRDAACELAFQGAQKSGSGSNGWKVDTLDTVFPDYTQALAAAGTIHKTAADIKPAAAADSLFATNFKTLSQTHEPDAFGHPANQWVYGTDKTVIHNNPTAASKNIAVTGAMVAGTGAFVTYNTTNNETNLVAGINTALNLSGSKALTAVATGAKVYRNGKDITAALDDVASCDEIEVYLDSNGKIEIVVMVRYAAVVIGASTDLTAAQITALEGTSAEGAATKISVDGTAVYDTLFADNSFTKGDYALVAMGKTADATPLDTVLAAKPVETVEGTITKKVSSGGSYVLTLGGKAYSVSGIASTSLDADLTNEVTAAATNFSDTYVLYLAQDGTYITIGKKTETADSSVVYAVDCYRKTVATAGSQYTDGTITLYYAQCVNLDGDIVNYQIKKAAYGTFATGLMTVTVAADKDAGNSNYAADYATLTPFATLDSALTASTAVSSTAVAKVVGIGTAIAADATSVAGTNGAKYYTNASQKVIFLGTGTLDSLNVTVKTGKTAVKDNVAYTIYSTGSATSANYNIQAIFVGGAAETATTGTGLIFGTGDASTVETTYTKADGTTGSAWVHNVWIDGEPTEILTASATAIAAEPQAYTITDSIYTMGTAYTKIVVGTIKNNNAGMVDINKTSGDASAPLTDVDLSSAKIVVTVTGEDADACATTAAKLTTEGVTVVYSGTYAPTVVYITAKPA